MQSGGPLAKTVAARAQRSKKKVREEEERRRLEGIIGVGKGRDESGRRV